MKLDFSQVDLLLLCFGFLAWGLALAFIWLRPVENWRSHRENDFFLWKVRENRHSATYSEFIASEQAPRSYLSKSEESIGVTGVGALSLYFALRDWGVFS